MFRRSVAALALLLGAGLPVSVVSVDAAEPPSTGLNDWACRPSAAHPRPVVLLHGLGSNAEQHWALHGSAVASAGYCVFALTYGANRLGMGGDGRVDALAKEIAAFVDRVLRATHSRKVDLVGHSLGGFMSLYVTKVSGYAAKVGRVVAMAPPTHGTTLLGALGLAGALGVRPATDAALRAACPACADLVEGGPAVVRLGDGPITQRGVRYTIIASRYDLVVTPSSRGFIRERRVRNYHVQDRCPLDPVGHFGFGMDTGATSMILNGLDPTVPVRCGFGPPV
ncbi:MAG: alpha/beta fold hydrolase [Actinomycetota bacterium]|nr:alpha/beta fold hydrolase [Actinomycetota bacterium]